MLNISPGLLMSMGTSAAKANLVAPTLEKFRLVSGDSYNSITSRNGIAMLVGQMAEESGCFESFTENLNYSVDALQTGNRSKYFTLAQAKLYGYVKSASGQYIQRANQQAIANLYYGGRMGNRGVNTMDGWMFRGGGWIQLTGRNNYLSYGMSCLKTAEQAADYVRTLEGAAHSAFWYWRSDPRIIKYAARGDVTSVSDLINTGNLDGKGIINLNARVQMFKRALAFLS